MISDAALAWSYMQVLNKQRYDALIDVFGGLETALGAVGESMLRELGMKAEGAINALLRLEDFNAAAYRGLLERNGIRFLTLDDPDYPNMLGRTADPPPFLYAIGDLGILNQPCIGLVGTRDMTDYGKRVAQVFTEGLVKAGMVTVSGLAAGIDTEVAKETLRSGGKTVGVFGHGFSIVFPAGNKKLAREIVDAGGLLLTEFAFDISPNEYTFPARNRIISGCSLGTVVLEAPVGSGALITADFALEDGRDVFAVPGPVFAPTYEGCHAFIASGRARLVSAPEEVLREVGVVAPSGEARASYEPANEEEKLVYGALTTMPQPADDLAQKTGLPVSSVGVALTMMELSGAVRNVGNGQWVRT